MRSPEPLVSRRDAAALAALSGVLYVLALPGVNVWLVAFVAYVPLLVAIRGREPREAAWLGLLSGTIASLGGFSWLYGMMRSFAELPPIVCALLTVVTATYQGGRQALVTWITARASKNGWPGEIAFVLASIGAELVYPLLFPWFFAFTMHDVPIFVQVADIGGVYLAGALLLGPNLAFAEIARAMREGARANRDIVMIGLLAPALGVGYGLVRERLVADAYADAPRVRVGLAQANLPLITRKGGVRANRELTEELAREGAELVVWSEGSIPDVIEEARVTREAHHGRVTANLGVPVIFGATTRSDDDAWLNSAYLADAEGKLVARYDKQYLLPFGEFIPFGKTFPRLYDLSPNTSRFSPGPETEPLVLDGHRITVLICYEDILPWFVNTAVNEGQPELLVNITIDTWFGDTLEPWEHLALAQLRAIEHRRYLVRATNSGVSAIVDPNGVVRKHGGTMKRESLLGEVRYLAPSTVYEVAGDLPWYGVAFLSVGFALTPRRRARSRARARS